MVVACGAAGLYLNLPWNPRPRLRWSGVALLAVPPVSFLVAVSRVPEWWPGGSHPVVFSSIATLGTVALVALLVLVTTPRKPLARRAFGVLVLCQTLVLFAMGAWLVGSLGALLVGGGWWLLSIRVETDAGEEASSSAPPESVQEPLLAIVTTALVMLAAWSTIDATVTAEDGVQSPQTGSAASWLAPLLSADAAVLAATLVLVVVTLVAAFRAGAGEETPQAGGTGGVEP